MHEPFMQRSGSSLEWNIRWFPLSKLNTGREQRPVTIPGSPSPGAEAEPCVTPMAYARPVSHPFYADWNTSTPKCGRTL
jgi:hypothetical protein